MITPFAKKAEWLQFILFMRLKGLIDQIIQNILSYILSFSIDASVYFMFCCYVAHKFFDKTKMKFDMHVIY